MSIEPRRRLGKYELQESLGQGGMAEVWKARDTQLQRYVAIKLLHANFQEDPTFIARFEREAQLIASLHHPNIVQIHDLRVSRPPESDTPIAYMVMAYVEGQTLADYISSTSARGKYPSPVEIVNLFTSISLAIDYAHQKGMIHRDIKPANILLDKHNTLINPMGEPILTDFGLARLLGMSSSTHSAVQMSTPLYTSPEQARGYPGNERSDLYALGIILYEIVTGVTPFRGDTPAAVVSQHLNAMPPSPVLINPNIPPALSVVLLQCLQKDPNRRFSSASSMVAAVANALNVPVPESLGQPAYPKDAWNMPTHLRPTNRLAQPEMTPLAERLEESSPPYSSPSPLSPTSSSGQVVSMTPASSSSGASFQSHPAQSPLPPTLSQPQSAVIPGGSGGREYPQGAALPGAPLPSAPSIPPLHPRKRWRGWYIALIVLFISTLIGSGTVSYYLFFRNNTTNPIYLSPIIEHAFLISSGQLYPGSAQGIADQLELDLQNIPDPAPGKGYYAWLLADRQPKAEDNPLQPTPQFTLPLLLTPAPLPVNRGSVSFFFKGTSQHDNLLSLASRMLITEEDTNGTPRGPAADRSTWRYYAEIPQTPYGTPPLSALDHIRHLFYKETKVAVLGLAGGLDIWLFQNTKALLEWAVSARDDYDTQGTQADQIHAQFDRILDYLDGSPNVHIDTNDPLILDPVTSSVGLLSVVPAQQEGTDLAHNPPGYLDHVARHLNGVVKAPDATPQLRKLAAQIIDALNNAAKWLKEARTYAQQLVKMDRNQLSQPAALTMMDHLLTDVTYAYIGQLDPQTNKVIPGIVQVHYDIQQLATLNLTKQLPQSI